MTDTVPRVIRRRDAEPHPLHGDGHIFRMIYPATAGSRNLFVGVAEVPPGTAPHVFHRHGVERIGEVELSYTADFEEFYYIAAGDGVMQWRVDATSPVAEEPVSTGDAIYMPPGCIEHRIFNNGSTTLRVVYGGTPPAIIRQL